MKNQKFKVGDKVYCPSTTTKICTVEEFGDVLCVSRNNKEHAPFNQHGISTITRMQFVFHATEENHKKLCDLYGVEFEGPSKQKEPKEIMKAMFDSGWKYVPCMVNYMDLLLGKSEIRHTINSTPQLFDRSVLKNYACNSIKPFDPRTGKIIIDFNAETGEIITE